MDTRARTHDAADDAAATDHAGAEPRARRHDDGAGEAPAPDATVLTEALRNGPLLRSVALLGLFVLALLYTFFLARAFFLPIAYAIMLNFLLSPAVRAMRRAHVPTSLGAALIVLSLVGVLTLGIYELADPAQRWIARTPHTLTAARAKLRSLIAPVQQVTRTAEQVERSANVAGPPTTPEVVVRGPSLSSRVFGTTRIIVVAAIEVIVLLYFLLAAGDRFLQKWIRMLPHLHDKKKAVQIAREAEASISTYLGTLALLNVGEGIVVASALALAGLANAPLWGVLVAALEFIPYLGAATVVLVLTLAGLATAGSVGHALLYPAIFLAINIVQANLVVPMVLGHRLTLNPVAVFVGLALWFWLWGIPGAFIAVPLVATFKIVCDHVRVLAPIGEFLGK
ncbi:MAG TPA: AI-2E family transporter [Gemmatimonadaceae bacterium]|nr:AI-2E family transporter [Gemmatimonadaceae bacterium]